MTRAFSTKWALLATIIAQLAFQTAPLSAENTCTGLEKAAEELKSLSATQRFNLAECYFQINEQDEIEGSLPEDYEAGLNALRLSADENFQPALLLLGDALQWGFWESDIDYLAAANTYARAIQNAVEQSLSESSVDTARIKYAQLGIQVIQWSLDRSSEEKEMFLRAHEIYKALLPKYSMPYGKSLPVSAVVEFSELCARVNFDKDISYALSQFAPKNQTSESNSNIGALCLLNTVGSDYGIEEFFRFMQEDWAREAPAKAWEAAIQALKKIANDELRVEEVPRAYDYSDEQILSDISRILAYDAMVGLSGKRDLENALAPLYKLAERGNPNAAGLVALILLENTIFQNSEDYPAEEVSKQLESLKRISKSVSGFDKAFVDFSSALLVQHERYRAIHRGGADNVLKQAENNEAMTLFKSSFEYLSGAIRGLEGQNNNIYKEDLKPLITLMAQSYVLSFLSPRSGLTGEYPDEVLEHATNIYEEHTGSNSLGRLLSAAIAWDNEDEWFTPMAWYEKEVIFGRFDVIPSWNLFSYWFSGITPHSARLYLAIGSSLCQQFCLSLEDRENAAKMVSENLNATQAFRSQYQEELRNFEVRIQSDEGISYIKENYPDYYETDSSRVANKFALIIANSDYSHLARLKSPPNDAIEFKKLITNKFGYEAELIENGSRTQIMRSIKSAVSRLKENDQFVLFYAGHGEVIDNTNYWIPTDARADEEFDWITEDFIKRKLRSAKSKNILVIVDSCFSGTITRGVSVGKRDLDAAAITEFKSRISRMALTSGGNEKVLDGGAGKHSVFTGALLNFMEGSEKPFTGAEMHSAIRSVVLKQSIAYGGKQIPQYEPLLRAGHEGGDFVFEPITEKK